jgi:hypothetical protein
MIYKDIKLKIRRHYENTLFGLGLFVGAATIGLLWWLS